MTRPTFERDLFISYAHVDNQASDSKQGWIDRLHERLELRLNQLLGERPDIWRDKKTAGNDVLKEKLRCNLTGARLLASILSPRYFKSDYCPWELREFHTHAQQDRRMTINGKACIFKVIKTPLVDPLPEDLHGILYDLLGYEFFSLDESTGRFREFSDEVGQDRDRRYWDRFEDLAQDLCQMIRLIKSSDDKQNSVLPEYSGKTIYLAETTSDLSKERDRLRRELLQYEYRLLPESPLPHTSQIRSTIENLLAQSWLSIHLVGGTYGVVPESEEKSIIELQHILAVARSKGSDFTQIIWLPSEISSTDERQQRFIAELLNYPLPPKGGELLRGKLEDLKSSIHRKLKATSSNGNREHKLVYLVCDQSDYDAVAPIEECLFQFGFEVLSLAGNNDPHMHEEYLMECDAVLTYCGQTADGWLNLKKIELMKLLANGRMKPLLAKAFYISAPQTSSKERFKIHDAIVIKNYNDFSCDSLTPFIEQIQKGKQS